MEPDISKQLRQAFSSNGIHDFRGSLVAKINSGQLHIAPRQSLILVERLLRVAQVLLLVANAGVTLLLVGQIKSHNTLAFLREWLGSLGEFRGLAWSAFIESVPLTILGLLLAALVALAFSLLSGRYIHRQLLTSNR
jgi:ABC-type phosphate/phosphonate transport system permease subunit